MTGILGEVNDERTKLACMYSIQNDNDILIAFEDIIQLIKDTVDSDAYTDVSQFREVFIKMAGIYTYAADLVSEINKQKR